jgi:hypothetical protein
MPLNDHPDAAAAAAPEVSVVISVQNRLDDLTDCLQALGRQTLPRDRFEVVVIDNCSSVDLAPAFELARTTFGLRLKTLRTTRDGGPAPARNLGVTEAQGAIIAFTDWFATSLELGGATAGDAAGGTVFPRASAMWAAIEVTVTISPLPEAINAGSSARVTRNVPMTLVSHIQRQSSRSASATGCRPLAPPALFTSTSTRSSRCARESTAAPSVTYATDLCPQM